jgi:hypothetical protein
MKRDSFYAIPWKKLKPNKNAQEQLVELKLAEIQLLVILCPFLQFVAHLRLRRQSLKRLKKKCMANKDPS